MNERKCCTWVGALCVLLSSAAWSMQSNRTAAPDEPPHLSGALAPEVMFALASLVGPVHVAPNGALVAYYVQELPAGIDPDARTAFGRFQVDGTPNSRLGWKLYIARIGADEGRIACDVDGATWAASWSADSKRLALYSNAGGAVRLWVYDVDSGECRKASDLSIKARLWSGDEAVWSIDGRSVYVPLKPPGQQPPLEEDFRVRPTHAELASSGAFHIFRHDLEKTAALNQDGGQASAQMLWEHNADVASVSLDSGDVDVLVPFDFDPRPSVVRRSASGRWLSYLSIFQKPDAAAPLTYDLVLVPSSGGGAFTVLSKHIVPRTDYYTGTYRWHPSQDRLIYLSEGGLWVLEVSAKGPGKPRRLGASLGPMAQLPLAFTRDGQHVIVGVEPDLNASAVQGPPPSAFAAIPLDGSPPIRLQADPARWQSKEVLLADNGVVWQPEADTVTLRAAEHRTGRAAIVRIELRSGREEVLWTGEFARLSASSASADHARLCLSYEDFTTPPDIYCVDGRFAKLQRISRVEPRLEGVHAGSYQVFETVVPHFDGTLRTASTGVIMPPGKKQGDRVPGIVMFYPGLNLALDRGPGRTGYAGGNPNGIPSALFTARGYAVVYAEVIIGPGNQPGNAMQEITDSLLPQVYKAAELGYVDIRRLAINGQSFGGYATPAVLSRTTLFRAGLAFNGQYDLGGSYGLFASIDNSASGGRHWIESSQPRIGTHPWADLRRVIDNSPFFQADKIRSPLFIVVGEHDQVGEAQKLYSALERLGRPVQLGVYEGSGHFVDGWPRANAIDVSKRAFAFLREHLGDPLAPEPSRSSSL